MDDSEDETIRFTQHQQSQRPYSFRPRPPSRTTSYRKGPNFQYQDANSDDSDDQEEEAQGNQGFSRDPDGYFNQNAQLSYEESYKRHPKKRKLENFVSTYSSAPSRDVPRSSHLDGGGRGGGWVEDESFVLLEVWGERYVELGRRSLRGEDWAEVAEKVSEMTGVGRSEFECRNQLDVLKKKYKKEKAKMENGYASKWPFYKKMDVLLSVKTRGQSGLGCGVDSGEYVFMNPRVYLDKSNVLDEMRDSPAESDNEVDEDEEEEVGEEQDREEKEGDGESAKMLAESIQRFSEVYERIESSKRKQMMELEKMRWDFQRDLELQKKQIVDMAQAEIARIRDRDEDDYQGEDEEDDDYDEDDEDNGVSPENFRG